MEPTEEVKTRRNPLNIPFVVVLAFAVAMAALSGALLLRRGTTEPARPPFTDTFNFEACTFNATGENPFFILKPGYQLVFDGVEAGDNVHLEITVLGNTSVVDSVTTRVVQENHSVNDEIEEISYNYFAICEETNSVVYFGENVDIYLPNNVTVHTGSWLAGGNNRPGIMMPGTVLLGGRYYQEVAPGIAEDRAEIVDDNVTLATPAGTFTGCLKTEETTPIEPAFAGNKTYAPGIGLVQDDVLLLTSYGYI